MTVNKEPSFCLNVGNGLAPLLLHGAAPVREVGEQVLGRLRFPRPRLPTDEHGLAAIVRDESPGADWTDDAGRGGGDREGGIQEGARVA